MKFLLDHDVPDEVARSLRYWGYEVRQLREVLPARIPDDVVFAHAQSEGSIIITCNRGHFLGLARQALAQGQALSGLVILIRRRSRQASRVRPSSGVASSCGRGRLERQHQYRLTGSAAVAALPCGRPLRSSGGGSQLKRGQALARQFSLSAARHLCQHFRCETGPCQSESDASPRCLPC